MPLSNGSSSGSKGLVVVHSSVGKSTVALAISPSTSGDNGTTECFCVLLMLLLFDVDIDVVGFESASLLNEPMRGVVPLLPPCDVVCCWWWWSCVGSSIGGSGRCDRGMMPGSENAAVTRLNNVITSSMPMTTTTTGEMCNHTHSALPIMSESIGVRDRCS
jgi:hypothetical protein